MRPIAHLAAAWLVLFAAAAVAETPALPVAAEATGVAEPSEEAWGDEWFDSAAKERAKAFEQQLVEEAGGAVGAPAPAADEERPAAQAPAPERAIVPPLHGPADLQAVWRTRREAILRQDAATAAEAEAKLRRLLVELDVREVHAFAAATVRESRKLEASAPAAALDRARLAVALAPSLPLTHLQLLRTQLAADPTAFGTILGIAADCVAAGLGDPRHVRLLVVDLLAALGAALLLAGAIALLFLAVAHCRSFLHDFHHLFPRRISRLQTGLLALLALALPIALGFGPLVVAALVLAAIWLYLDRAERIALGLWLALAALLPAGAGFLAARLAWDDTRAASLYAVERAGDFSSLRGLAAVAREPGADPETIFVVARSLKRLGQLEEAQALYERALASRPRWPAALINLGNIRFLRGDAEGAEELYTRAIDLDPGIAAAYFSLSRVHYDRVDFTLGQAARTRAIELDRRLVEKYAVSENGSAPANQYVVDVPLPDEDLAKVAARSEEPRRLERQLTAAILGPIPGAAAPFSGGGFALLLVVWTGFLAQRIRPASGCSRCGRAVCSSCDPESAGGNLCGQCVHVFGKRAAVEAAAREAKERAAKAHQSRRSLWFRAGALVLAGPFLSGRIGRGMVFLLLGWFLVFLAAFPAGVVQPVYEGWPAVWKVALLLPPIGSIFLLAWRDARGGR